MHALTISFCKKLASKCLLVDYQHCRTHVCKNKVSLWCCLFLYYFRRKDISKYIVKTRKFVDQQTFSSYIKQRFQIVSFCFIVLGSRKVIQKTSDLRFYIETFPFLQHNVFISTWKRFQDFYRQAA